MPEMSAEMKVETDQAQVSGELEATAVSRSLAAGCGRGHEGRQEGGRAAREGAPGRLQAECEKELARQDQEKELVVLEQEQQRAEALKKQAVMGPRRRPRPSRRRRRPKPTSP